jgi:hypothetical protein
MMMANLLFTVLVWGIIGSGIAVFVERRYGGAWVWRAWAAAVVLLTAYGTLAFHRSFPNAGSVVTTVYMASVFSAIPSAVISYASIRLGKREPKPTWLRHVGLCLVAYFLALPFAFVLGVLPDLARLF